MTDIPDPRLREALASAIAKERGRRTWVDMIDYGAADRITKRLAAAKVRLCRHDEESA